MRWKKLKIAKLVEFLLYFENNAIIMGTNVEKFKT